MKILKLKDICHIYIKNILLKNITTFENGIVFLNMKKYV